MLLCYQGELSNMLLQEPEALYLMPEDCLKAYFYKERLVLASPHKTEWMRMQLRSSGMFVLTSLSMCAHHAFLHSSHALLVPTL